MRPWEQHMGDNDPRFLIAAARRMLFRGGADSQVGGHVSLRADTEDAFYVTPFEYMDETLPDHVAKVNFALEVEEPGRFPASPGINFHADIYRARMDVNCIVHTHARNATLLSSISRTLDPFQIYAAIFLDRVGFFVDDPSLTPDLEGAEIAKALGRNRALLISHHGVIHVGQSISMAVGDALLFELAAGYQLAAVGIQGAPMARDTALTYQKLYDRIGFQDEVWRANLRRLEKSDPELFTQFTNSSGD